MKRYSLFFFVSVFVLELFAQNGYNFYYTRTYEKMGLNVNALNSLNFETQVCNCLEITKFLCNEDSKIMQFERYRYGELYIDSFGFVRDIVLIKVIDGFIVESYFIPCDWKEPPITAVILFSNKRVKFTKKIRLKKLKLKNIEPNTVNILDNKGWLVSTKILSEFP